MIFNAFANRADKKEHNNYSHTHRKRHVLLRDFHFNLIMHIDIIEHFTAKAHPYMRAFLLATFFKLDLQARSLDHIFVAIFTMDLAVVQLQRGALAISINRKVLIPE